MLYTVVYIYDTIFICPSSRNIVIGAIVIVCRTYHSTERTRVQGVCVWGGKGVKAAEKKLPLGLFPGHQMSNVKMLKEFNKKIRHTTY